MKPTGLPLLPISCTAADARAWRLWLDAAVERVRREAATQAMSGDQQRGRVEGAERVREWLISSLPSEPVAD